MNLENINTTPILLTGQLSSYTFTRVDNDTIEVDADLTDFLRVGLAIYFEVGATQYSGYITGTPTLVSGNTQFEVILNNHDAPSVASNSETIETVPVSDFENFQISSQGGFGKHNGLINFNASWIGGGSMEFTNITNSQTSFFITGKKCTVYIYASGTTSGSATNSIYMYLPVNLSPKVTELVGQNTTIRDGSFQSGFFQVSSSNTAVVQILPQDFSNWGLGSNRQIIGTVNYPIA